MFGCAWLYVEYWLFSSLTHVDIAYFQIDNRVLLSVVSPEKLIFGLSFNSSEWLDGRVVEIGRADVSIAFVPSP